MTATIFSRSRNGFNMELNDLLERVNSKETFLRFAQALADDFRDEQEKEAIHPTPYLGVVQGANGWYNHSVDGFLRAMCAWARATSSITDEPMVPEQPSWRSFAEILYEGKHYE